jgi:hypothetical protein
MSELEPYIRRTKTLYRIARTLQEETTVEPCMRELETCMRRTRTLHEKITLWNSVLGN